MMTRASTKRPNKTARLLYRPWGLAAGMVGGLVAGQIFQQVWKRVDSEGAGDPPTPLQSEYPLSKILVAAVIHGAIFAVVRALIDRGGARAFERWTGEWPGD